MEDSLHSRGKAMEDIFFAQSDQALLEKLRAQQEAKGHRQALEHASGISDPAILDQLDDSGITPESLTSVALIPLVAVAWADRKMDGVERAAILKAAAASGIEADSVSHQTLESWLANRPGPELMATWKSYIGAIKHKLDASAFNQLKASVCQRAKEVAEKTGGFLNMVNTISDQEQKVLDEMEATFE